MSTAASVSTVELKARKAEIGPRATATVSTGTRSAAACRAFSFSASAAFLSPSFVAPPALLSVADEAPVDADALPAAGAVLRLQLTRNITATRPVQSVGNEPTTRRRGRKSDTGGAGESGR